jgi:hypothetical protein
MRALILTLALGFSGAANASVLSWNATPLTGATEAPPVSTPASGTASGTYDTVSHVITWDVTYADLTGNLILGHIHGPAPANVPAPILIDFFGGRVSLPSSGSFSGSADLDGDPLLSPVFDDVPLSVREQQLFGGLWYVNLHSPAFPAGEIRQQIAIPEPGTLALLAAVGIALLMGRARRR